MIALLFLIVSSFILAVILTPVCRDIFQSAGMVDMPDEWRKTHPRPVARVGGVAIALAYVGAYALFLILPPGRELFHQGQLEYIFKILPAGLLILATGLLDDLFNLKPWQKLLGQAAAASWAYWAGVRVLMMFGGHANSEWWSFPLTLLWLVACANAFNFIDGVDGLAAGLGFFATVTMLVAALLDGNMNLALATVPLAGCLLGFLLFNFHPASIFLGDSGSLLIGFMLGCFGVIWGQKSATLLGMTAPLMALAVPILDVCLSVIRRSMRRQHIFTADRGHIHHRLLDRGWEPRTVALILYGVAALGAIFSVFQSVYHNQYSRLIIILFCAAASLGIRNLNYIEFDLMRGILFGGEFTALLNARVFLEKFERSLQAATGLEQCRIVVEQACRELGFSRVKMRLAGELFETDILPGDKREQYQLLVTLNGADFIHLTRGFDSAGHPTIVGSFIETLRTSLIVKLSAGFGIATSQVRAIAREASIVAH